LHRGVPLRDSLSPAALLQVQELGDRRSREGETAGGTAQRLDARLMVSFRVTAVIRAETCRPRLTGPRCKFTPHGCTAGGDDVDE